MVTLFHDLAQRQQDDVVSVLNGGETVSNDQHGANVLHLFQRVLNQNLRLSVDVGGCFVQDHNAWLVDDGASEGEQLSLTGREVVASFTNHFIQTIVQFVDEGISVDIAAGFHDLFVGDALFPEDDVAADITGKEENILKHLTEVFAERGDLDLLDIDAVDQNLALLNVVVAADQREDGGLTGTGGTNKGDSLFWIYVEGYTFQNPFIRFVGEPNILELDLTFDLIQFDGIRFINNFRNHIQNGEHLFCRSEGTLQHIELFSQSLNWVEEAGDVHIEGYDDTAVNDLTEPVGLIDVAAGTHVKQAHNGGDVQHIDHWTEDTKDKHSVPFCILESDTAFQEVLHFAFFLVEDLGDLDTGKVFRQVGVQVSGGIAYTTMNFTGEFTEDNSEENNEWNEAENHQGQCIVQHQHGTQYTEDYHGILSQGNDDIGEHIRNSIWVIADTGYQLANRDVVQLFMGKFFDVDEGILTDGRQDLLTDALQDHSLSEGTYHGYDQNAGVDEYHGQQLIQLKITLHQLDQFTDEPWGYQVVNDGEEHDEEDQDELLVVRFSVLEQTLHDVHVLHVAVEAHGFFFILFHEVYHQEDGGEDADDGAHDQNWQEIMHCERLLPLQVSAGLPSWCIPDRFRTDLCEYRRQPVCRRR